MNRHISAIFNSYSEIFFLQHYGVGILLLATTLVNPNVALAGVISMLAAYLFALFIKMGRVFLNSGFYTYNPLLVGLAIGYLFKLTPQTIFFLVTSGVLTFVVTVVMFSVFSTYLKLPVLSLPFVIVSSIAYLASSQYSNLSVNGMYPHAIDKLELSLPFWIAGYLKSFGAIFFMPQVIPGLIIAMIILLSSRILFLLSAAGYFTGALITALMVGSFQQAFSNLNHFNFILIAMAVGGIFLIPSLKSYTIALIAVCTATILLDSVLVFWSYFALPGFTLPFNVVSLSFIYVLGLIDYPHMARLVKRTPEETLDLHLTNRLRFKGSERTVMLPFAGKWTVWQGCDGKWTHKGSWRYAYDFIISDEKGRSYRGSGTDLNDYLCYRKPVLSPVQGRVVKVIDHLSDNPIGRVEEIDNWGNLVIIRDDRGFYAEISHFAQDSIKVKEGEWIERGALLGLCGNSGYSPQPHVHIQVQDRETVGSYTTPFSFVSYAEGSHFRSKGLPEEGTTVEAMHWNKGTSTQLSFILDRTYRFEVLENGRKMQNLDLEVKMASDGTFYFDSGRGKLFFGKHEGTFYCYSVEGNDRYLDTILLSLPRLPLACRPHLEWNDFIPAGVVKKGIKKALIHFVSSFYHDFIRIEALLTCIDEKRIEGVIKSSNLQEEMHTFVELDDTSGFRSIRAGDIELRRIDDEKSSAVVDEHGAYPVADRTHSTIRNTI